MKAQFIVTICTGLSACNVFVFESTWESNFKPASGEYIEVCDFIPNGIEALEPLVRQSAYKEFVITKVKWNKQGVEIECTPPILDFANRLASGETDNNKR